MKKQKEKEHEDWKEARKLIRVASDSDFWQLAILVEEEVNRRLKVLEKQGKATSFEELKKIVLEEKK